MYKIKQSRKLFALSAIAAGLVGWGSANAIQYYNLTQVNADGVATQGLPGGLALDNYQATINNALFTTVIPPTIVGTGVIDPFIRIQHIGSANCANSDSCVEMGYNTNGGLTANPGPGNVNKAEFEGKDNEGTNWNRALALGDIGTELINGVLYRTFILDINERMAGSKGDEYLSLDQFRLFVANDGNLDDYDHKTGALTSRGTNNGGAVGDGTYNPLDDTLGAAGKTNAINIYEMDRLLGGACDTASTADGVPGTDQAGNPSAANPNVCDRTVGINYALNSGSGNGVDLLVRVPDALFFEADGVTAKGNYVYLFSSFGELGPNADNGPQANKPASNLPAGDFGASAGFEEWATLKKTPIAPTLALFAVGLVAMGGMRKLRFTPRFA